MSNKICKFFSFILVLVFALVLFGCEPKVDEKEVLKTILELQKDRLITFDVAVPLDQNNNDSLRYMATTKEYFERKTLDG